jgi:NAD-dependent DNA ligase
VTKGVDFLVIGSDGGRNKAAAAEKLGTKCITEEDLFGLMGSSIPVAQTAAFVEDP